VTPLIGPGCIVQEAAEIILKRNIYSFPIEVNNELIGIITDRDILRTVATGMLT